MVVIKFIKFYLCLYVFCSFEHLLICQENDVLFSCGTDDLEILPKADEGIPINRARLLQNKIDSDGFKDFKIYFDPFNLVKDLKNYNLIQYKNMFLNGIKKAIETLQKLLKVKPLKNNHLVKLSSLKRIGIDIWDTEKFGDESFYTNSSGYDLIIFGRLADLGSSTLASATPIDYEIDGPPFTGLVNINYNIDYSREKSEEYFQSIMIHEFTHILGFLKEFFQYIFHNIFYKNDAYGITRAYINSNKVLEVARKYFDCPDLSGVALEEYGGVGTFGSHWDSRILYGEYMNAATHQIELVISEFTLALLEDTGTYKANYYTGGLMRLGKHKGCSFIMGDCINRTTHLLNPLFENEFFDSISYLSNTYFDPSCSSGRQSRTVFYFSNYVNDLPEAYRYFGKYNQGGYKYADYCPVAEADFLNEDYSSYFSFQCSEKGNGKYGEFISYKKGSTSFSKRNEELNSIFGEVISNKSFCFLSSLIKNGTEDIEIFSRIPRAICYELFCSEKSLTVQIHDDYVICPRAGGKIELEGYEGYFLCPDYNLMCSGTVICNDMFDCVDKKSEVKNSSYYYDYEIKTSQNIERAEIEDADNITNYELSEEAICPIYCKYCKKNKRCMKCKQDYGLVGNYENETIECLDLNELINGYFKFENETYYKCLTNCEICSNALSCDKCIDNYELVDNKCISKIENCKEYDEKGKCSKCNDDYAFIKNNRDSCINISEIYRYYTFDDGISYFPCDESIINCQNCIYYKEKSKVQCILCKNDLVLVDIENKCYFKEELDKNKSYFYINDTHAKKCSEEIENCSKCNSKDTCIKCIENYYLFNNETKICYEQNQIPFKDCYLNEENTTYYLCNNTKYNSINNCKRCSSNNSCSFCQEEYTFINGNKSLCIEKKNLIEGLYIPDINDTSNYIKCSYFINNCDICNVSQCHKCDDGYIFIDGNFLECISKESINLDLFFSYDNITFYSCSDEKYKDNEKCKRIFSTTISSEGIKTTIINLETTFPYVKTTIPNMITLPTTDVEIMINGTQNYNYTEKEKIQTTIIKKNNPQIKEKIFFILQVQFINGKIIILLLINFPISKNQYFTFTVSLYSYSNRRNLQQNQVTKKEISFSSVENYDGNKNKIITLNSLGEYTDIEKVSVEDLSKDDKEEIQIVLLDDNSEILNSEKVKNNIENGDIDYYEISKKNNINFNIYKYKIISSTNGCKFSLITDQDIKINDKNIELKFSELSFKENITSNCLISEKNGNKIICSLNENLDNYYSLNPFIYSDKTEIFVIFERNNTEYLQLKCEKSKEEDN